MTREDKSIKKELEPQRSISGSDPRLIFKCVWDEKTGSEVIQSIDLANGEKLNPDTFNKFLDAFKVTVGSENYEHVVAILSTLAQGMPQFYREDQLNHIATLLPLVEPQDKIEAMLFGQFIALHEFGLKQLGSANRQGVPIQQEKSISQAIKLLNTANQTMQTLIKYRSRGQQTVQVVHVHNEGQAIVTQNLASKNVEGGGLKKNEN